jgi:hypothetical protein
VVTAAAPIDESEFEQARYRSEAGFATEEETTRVLVAGILRLAEQVAEGLLFPYQSEVADRLVESVVIGDRAELTILQARQSGKTETIACCVVALMILMPRLAEAFPDRFAHMRRGFLVGVFAPTEEQALTMWDRIEERFTSELMQAVLEDVEIQDQLVKDGPRVMTLSKCKSLCRVQTANPRANIESKTYHLIVIDEAQDADAYKVRKSIHPMAAFHGGTIVKAGSGSTKRGDFHTAIQRNRRRQVKHGARRYHFEYDWRYCARYNARYRGFVEEEKIRIGEDSDEFRMSYDCIFLLERGMFTTQEQLDALGDVTMPIQRHWHASRLVAGLDLGRKQDNTVLTVVWVDWDHPDPETGFYDHRILNWLELQGDQWETQYAKIVRFLRDYSVVILGVDGQGGGDVVADRLTRLLPHIQVEAVGSNTGDQGPRWSHLMALMGRGLVSWPARADTKRLKIWQRFETQMRDLEKEYRGRFLLAAAPNESDAHDDFPDSLAIACQMTRIDSAPMGEVADNVFFNRNALSRAG